MKETFMCELHLLDESMQNTEDMSIHYMSVEQKGILCVEQTDTYVQAHRS